MRLIQFLLVLSIVGFCYSFALADSVAANTAPQDLTGLWPMVGLCIATVASYLVRKLSSEYTFFHSGTGAVVLGALGAIVSSVTPIFQAGTVTWAALVWAAIGGVTSFFATLNPSTTKDAPPVKSPAAASKLSVLLPLVFVVFSMSLAGCHGYKAPTYATLATMASASGLAAQKLPAICEGQENAAVDNAKTKDEAVTTSSAIHHRCDLALTSLEGIGKGLKSARDAVQDAPAGSDMRAVLPWMHLITRQYCDAVPLLSVFGVTLPTFPGVC